MMKGLLSPILFLFLTSCAWFNGTLDRPERFHTIQFEASLTPREQSLFGNRQPRLGIALSGGGIRSAFYVAGALEALYERRVLQRADIISTVSGGGYTAYWLYAGQIAADDTDQNGDFGSALLGPRKFPLNMCDLSTRANFVTVLRWPAPPSRCVADSFMPAGSARFLAATTRALAWRTLDAVPAKGFPT